jgi:hypothetical protein
MSGIVRIARCRERETLELEIHKVVRELACNAREAANIAGGGQQVDFEHLRESHALLSERLRVLEHCLNVHKEWHGC